MKISERLNTVTRLFLDTAPVIYFVERNPTYHLLVQSVFDRIDAGALTAITSPVTLAECLVHPYRRGLTDTAQSFIELIVAGSNTTFAPIEQETARRAAELRARYNLALADAFQFAVALTTACDALLTNDAMLKRVIDLDVIVLDEIEPEAEETEKADDAPETTK